MTAEPKPGGRLVIVSNRLPVVVRRRAGEWKIEPGAGGLVTAFAPVLRRRGGLWIGWPGTSEAADMSATLLEAGRRAGCDLRPVPLSAQEVKGYYHGFSNQVMWPLLHDLEEQCNFDPEFWRVYDRVNQKFAEAILGAVRPDEFVWIQDYHLMCVARHLRRLGCRARLGFFLHTPFPPADIFAKLPWREEILRSLLQHDLIGFQTLRDRGNFLQAVRRHEPDAIGQGKGQVHAVRIGDRTLSVGSFPIGIDFDEFDRGADRPEVQNRARALRKALPDRQRILGIDRLDYTKGIPVRLRAIRNALTRHPNLRGRVTLIQIVVPSRDEISQYRALKEEIERLVGEINGEFTLPGWVPIHYMYRSLDRRELLAYYLAAEIALVTPLRDGMNLVAKEFCAASTDGNGVLILSEFAGAAEQLGRSALLVNPYDIEGVADALAKAVSMPLQERRARMQKLRQTVRRSDVFRWVDSILQSAAEASAPELTRSPT